MLSPRVIAVLCLGFAAVAALPADKPAPRPIITLVEDDVDDSPWFSFPMFGNFFEPLWRLFPSFGDLGPKIVSDDNKFQVIVNVKDYNKNDLKVKVRGDFIFVQGTHEDKHADHDVFASQFFHTYSLPLNCSSSDVIAELSTDGFLIVSAPISAAGANNTKTPDREVPIKETGEPFKSEDTNKTTVVPSNSENDRKEDTTPSIVKEQDSSTEKDNVIPHGNEVIPL